MQFMQVRKESLKQFWLAGIWTSVIPLKFLNVYLNQISFTLIKVYPRNLDSGSYNSPLMLIH